MAETPIGTVDGRLSPSTMSDEDWRTLRFECEQVFTPGTPIRENELFAGRKPQIEKLSQRIRSPGTHAVIYGERGVGKSSLVNVFRYIADASANRIQYIRVAGVANDSFTSLFLKVFKRMSTSDNGDSVQLSEKYEGKTITADDILLEFQGFALSAIPIIVIDELDKIANKGVREEIAETIKLVSDEGANVTFFVVGIADNIEDLIEGHESIDRAIAQVEMPRMADHEIIDIILPRARRLGLRITEDALWECVFLAKGLPHYAQLLGLHGCQACCDQKIATVGVDQIREAEARSIGESNSTIRANFDDAIFSERSENLFLPVLLACALVPKDATGRFIAKDVARVLSDVTGTKYEVPAFSYHLDQFTTKERGKVLEKLGVKRQFKFRFREALVEPYVVMKGRAANLITEAIEKKYGPKRQRDLFASGTEQPS